MDPSEDNAIFNALADPNRRAILSLVGRHEEISSGAIAEEFEIGRSAVSTHLRILRLAGLVTERREGRYRFYSLNSKPADAVVMFLAEVYENSLDQLAAVVEDASTSTGEQSA